MNEPELTVVIPCYNEAENIPLVMPGVFDYCRERNYRVVIVDDGSSDGSAGLLREYAAGHVRVVRHKLNRGYGAALKTGLEAAATPWAITMDADGQHRMADVDRLLEHGRETDADMVVGSRPENSSGLCRSLGKKVIRGFARMLLKLTVRDLNSGMKLYRMDEVRRYLPLCPGNMAFSDIIVLLMVNDRRLVKEVPIQVEPRLAGKSTIGPRTALETMVEIASIAMLLRPLKLFSILGMILLAGGILWGGFVYWRSSTITASATMLALGGMLCFILGLLAEQLAQIRRGIFDKRSE